MYSQTILIGRLGKDPEIRYTPGGTTVASFSMATDNTWNKDGEKQTKTSWHNITAFGKLAEIIESYVRKGQQIMVSGRLDYQSWEDREGNKKYKTVIIIDTMKMLGSKKEGGVQPLSKAQPAPSEQVAGQGDIWEEDDIPF